MRTLHVGAMPFPSPQGTQALVRSMLDALDAAGSPPRLLCYAHGDGSARPPWPIHRVRDFPRVTSLRSGPSLGKAALDLAMTRELRALWRQLRPDVVVAHNVEACAVAIAARVRPLVYYAHTAFGTELETYGPSAATASLRWAGGFADYTLCRRARAVFAVSPLLAELLQSRSGAPVRYLDVPWPVPPEIDLRERIAARRALAIPEHAFTALYAGNLDAYQGWQALLGVLPRMSHGAAGARLLVATASDPGPLWEAARARGVAEALRVTGLATEVERRRAHAVADVVVVPRRAPGGLPVKLLDAMARGCPVVATERAAAGLPLEEAACIVPDDDPAHLANGLLELMDDERRRRLGQAAREHVARAHAPRCFAAGLEAALMTC